MVEKMLTSIPPEVFFASNTYMTKY